MPKVYCSNIYTVVPLEYYTIRTSVSPKDIALEAFKLALAHWNHDFFFQSRLIYLELTVFKGKLISKCPFGVFKSSKNEEIFSRISALASNKKSNQKSSVRELKVS